MRRAAALAVLALVAAGCHGAHRLRADPSVHVPPDLPPAPATWPAYPRFPARSCWGSTGSGRAAPSYVARRPGSPDDVVRRVLARFGDGRYVKRVELIPADDAPRAIPFLAPAGALWASFDVPERREPSADRRQPYPVPRWEVDLVYAALRDELCAAGGPPLAGWSERGGEASAGNSFVFGQVFPNPSPAGFRARAALIGRRFGFRVVSIRMLRPLQLAPLVVIETDRRPKAFVQDLDRIARLLDPSANGALTFEGLYLVAENGKGSFATFGTADRGGGESSEWTADPCWLPGLRHGPPVLGGGGRACR